MKTTIESLPDKFTGTGEVKGFEFTKLKESKGKFLYQVEGEGKVWYEVVKSDLVPKCINFNERLYSDTDFKYTYPKAKDFGRIAWTKKSIEEAEELYREICRN